MTLRLSECIRLGAMLHPQCFNAMYERNEISGIIASCALGAAALAGWRPAQTSTWDDLCPVCDGGPGSVMGVVQHLNDDHRWTREAIAAWVATTESQEVSVPEEVTL